MAIASISSSLPSVGGGNAAAAGGRLPDVESSRARENTASAKVAPPEPPRVFRTSVSLHPDDRIAGLNKIVAQVIDSQKKQWLCRFHRSGRLIYRSNCAH